MLSFMNTVYACGNLKMMAQRGYVLLSCSANSDITQVYEGISWSLYLLSARRVTDCRKLDIQNACYVIILSLYVMLLLCSCIECNFNTHPIVVLS